MLLLYIVYVSRVFIIDFQPNSCLSTISPFQIQITSITEETKALVLILLILRFLCHKRNVFMLFVKLLLVSLIKQVKIKF